MTTTTNSFASTGDADYMSNRMDWETPTDLFARLDDEFHFLKGRLKFKTNGVPDGPAPFPSMVAVMHTGER